MTTLRALLCLFALSCWLPASAQEGRTALAELAAADLSAAVSAYATRVEAGEIRGAVLMVVQDRRVLAHEALGCRDLAGERPMQPDSLFRMASNTKAVTAASVLALADDGKLQTADPIHRFFPSFDHGQSAEITISHLLTHTSGLRIPTLFLQPLMTPSAEHPDAPNLVLEVARFGEVGAVEKPGTTWRYNNPGYNTLAGLVEVVAKQPFAEFARQRFYEPLGMRDTCHHESVADHERMSAIFRSGADGAWQLGWQPGDDPDLPFVRGSGGMISTAEDFAKFCQLFLDDGTHDGEQLLSKKAVRAATTSQTGLKEHGYGFGWRVTGPGQFEHGGSDGTWAWCDRERALVGLVFTQTQGRAVSPARQEFRNAVHAALDAAPRRGAKRSVTDRR